MIIREWRGRASPKKAEAYPEHFRRAVVPELRRIPGFLGARLCRRSRDGTIEYLVLTRWASMEAIRAFAGAEPEKAVVEPGAIAALSDYDGRVQHYEVVEEVASAGN
jgi:heme-degrading monooxygenase HmoA